MPPSLLPSILTVSWGMVPSWARCHGGARSRLTAKTWDAWSLSPDVWQLMDSCKLVPGAPRGFRQALSPHRSQPTLLSREKQDWPFPIPASVCAVFFPWLTHPKITGQRAKVGGSWPSVPSTISMSPASWKPDLHVAWPLGSGGLGLDSPSQQGPLRSSPPSLHGPLPPPPPGLQLRPSPPFCPLQSLEDQYTSCLPPSEGDSSRSQPPVKGQGCPAQGLRPQRQTKHKQVLSVCGPLFSLFNMGRFGGCPWWFSS